MAPVEPARLVVGRQDDAHRRCPGHSTYPRARRLRSVSASGVSASVLRGAEAGRERLAVGPPALEGATQRGHPDRVGRCAIRLLARFLRAIEECHRIVIADEHVVALAQALEETAMLALAVLADDRRPSVGARLRSARQPGQAPALEMRRRRDAEQLEHGGHDVDHAGGLRHPRALRHAPREAQHERDVQRALVEVVVQEAAVLAERLAVVRREHDERVVGDAERVELVEQRGQRDVVHVANARVVEVGHVADVARVGAVDGVPEEPGARAPSRPSPPVTDARARPR